MLFSPQMLARTKPTAVGAAWTPASLPGLKVWLDATVTASVHLSSSNVTQWDDQSGIGNNFVQATSARQPTYSATGFNSSKPGVTVVAANSQFVRNTSVGFNSATAYYFVVLTHTVSGGNQGAIVCFVGSGAANDFGDAKSFIQATNGSTGFRLTANDFDDLSITLANSTPGVVGGIFNGASSHVYLDFSAGSNATHTGTLGNTTADIAFGSRPWNGNTPSWDGTYGEIVIGEGVPSAGDLTSFHSYCQTKWGTP